jgi:glycosyltransferase involved in cell wall biosynthesis
MRILLINYEFPPLGGGGGVACYQIARELAKKHEVDYLTTSFRNLPKFELVEGISVYRVPVLGRKELSTATFLSMLSFIPMSLAKGLGLCKKNKYDIINSFFVMPSGISSIILSKVFKIPIIMSALGGDLYDPSKRTSPHRHLVLRGIISKILNNSDIITTESTNLKDIMKKYYSPKKEIVISPLGLVASNFQKKTRNELDLSEEDIILISVGRLVTRKGYEYAIQAIAELMHPNIKYLIIGDGPEMKRLQQLAMCLGVGEKVKFIGFIPDEMKFQYLMVSDIYVLPSLHEGFGICLLEAMHCGLPIVSTDNGGQTDFLKEGRNSLFVPIKDANALASKIEKLISEPDLRIRIKANNRIDISNFYIDKICMNCEEIYRKALK